MIKLTLDKQNLYVNVEGASPSALAILNLTLRKRQEGFIFSPRYKAKRWDGYDKFLHVETKRDDDDMIIKKYKFGVGLWKEAVTALQENHLPFDIVGFERLVDKDINQVKLNSFVEMLLEGVMFQNKDGEMEQLTPRDYQFEAAYRALKYRYCTQELATSAGKTIIFYIYLAYLKFKKRIAPDKKALVVVPKVSLLNQTYDAFLKEYHTGLINMKVMRVGDKYKFKKETFDECEVLISTYQSLANIPKEIFSRFNVICIDEAHTSRGKTINDIVKASVNASYRFGLSGTIQLDKQYSHLFKIQEFIGPLRLVVTADFLQEQGYAPRIKIKRLSMLYPEDGFMKKYRKLKDEYKELGCPPGFADPKAFGQAMFEMEKQYLYASERRLEVISNLVKKLPGNTLILFNNIKDEYGITIQDEILKWNEHTYYVDGSVKVVHRESFQKDMEANEGVVIVASYGTFSTGLNLKRLHNIVFAESSKSEITIRQSIGRGMRMYVNKNEVTIFDLVDVFPGMTHDNYMVAHSKVRAKFYKEQKFQFSEHQIKI